MTNKEAYEMREKREKELQEELLRVQCDGEDKGYIYAGRLDFDYSEFWFQIETFTAEGRIYPHYFACKTLADLKEAIRWILKDTAFGEATAYVEGYSYVTFGSLATLDRKFRYYYE
ncbi:MAG: hypothetical protein LUG93_05990 [Lachnospiraceae bacterium]|nr:hypothetical protein [Lachnospiraceae bacterium]